ncbi:uncharacterized protein MELLADRAFT_92156 [Melampsora larici-populina 98AG31]|uniref:Uncharacterized protein n=1 Tax=Melampsora larici-populina (strain 98AG31 / pathotype 3-4-7) TaxID=747676 RepID=F4S1Q0_MELLP|nr:uncharacterized protein MELLADRAFT_92156 [Melampsora larici-populina 98AG31]EGG01467.1 hypothetical protein MELLADRAFT_92156 [Melampsora larici-populina 98AG31]
MLNAFRATYGYVPYEPEAEVPRGRTIIREAPRVTLRWPRTASLIADGESVRDEPAKSLTSKKTHTELSDPATRRTPMAEQVTRPTPEPQQTQKKAEKATAKESDDLANPEDKITFVDDQQLPNNSLLKLSHCFHTKMTKLKAFVPLTVFNIDWIDKDAEKASQRKVKTVKELQEGDDSMQYSGLTPKDELLLTYGDWLDNMDLFIRYVDEYYNMKTCAENFKKHRQNVIDIRRSTSCWTIALRYCIRVRKLVMQFRFKDGKRVMANAGLIHEDILCAAKDKADALGKRSYLDNPYVGVNEAHEQALTKEKSLIKREFAAANQSQSQSQNGWKNNGESPHLGGGKKRYPKNNNKGFKRNGNNHHANHGNSFGRDHRTFPQYPSQQHSVPYNPYHAYQPYPYTHGTNQNFIQGGAGAGPSEPSNQLAIIAKPAVNGSGNQSGALAIVHRNNGNKCTCERAGRVNTGLRQRNKEEKGELGKKDKLVQHVYAVVSPVR